MHQPRNQPGRDHGRQFHLRALVGALAALSLVMGACDRAPAPQDGAADGASLDSLPCGARERWSSVAPLASDPDGPITGLSVTSDAPELSGSTTLFVRVEMADGAALERLLIDTDSDRLTGMWTAQSHLSSSGWNFMADESGLYRHAGAPTEWKFDPVDAEGYEVETDGNDHLFCIPLAALGEGGPLAKVALAAENADASLPAQFLAGAAYSGTVSGSPRSPLEQERISLPGRLAFNYSGMPWLVRDCREAVPNEAALACAVRVYEGLDHLVLDADFDHEHGAGVERFIARLNDGASPPEVWGYVSLVGSTIGAEGTREVAYSVDDIARLARGWKRAGASGVFVDEFDICDPAYETCHEGPEGPIEITREHQVAAVEAIHSLGLPVFANGHSVLDSLGVHRGIRSPLGPGDGIRRADVYLLENPTISGGAQVTGFDFRASSARFEQAVALRQRTGVRLAVLDTVAVAIPDDANAWPDYAIGWWRAVQAGASAYAFANAGPAHFDGNLPVLDPPPGFDEPFAYAFAAGPIARPRGGAVMTRFVVDCTGQRIGSVTVEDSSNGLAAGFERTSPDDPGC